MVAAGFVPSTQQPSAPRLWWAKHGHWAWPAIFGVLAAAGAVAAFVLADAAQRANNAGHRHVLYVWGGIAVGVPVIIGSVAEARRSRRLRVAADVVAELETAFNNALGDFVGPLADLLGCIAAEKDPAQKARLRGQLEKAITSAAVALCGEARCRAAFYERAKPGPGAIQRLERRAWEGRGDEPRLQFVRNRQGRDNAVISFCESEELLFVPDVRTENFAAEYATKDYKTFISVAVRTAGHRHGMLVIDAPEPGDLDRTHTNVMRALAKLLAAGITG
jgi:hypothetical protein